MTGEQNLKFNPTTEDNEKESSLIHLGGNDKGEQISSRNYAPDDPPTARKSRLIRFLKIVIINGAFVTFFVFATLKYIKREDECTEECGLALCSPYGMLLFVSGATCTGAIYSKIIKRYFGKAIQSSVFRPIGRLLKFAVEALWSRIVIILVIVAAFVAYIIFETSSDFSRLRSLIGIFSIIIICCMFSAHPRRIKWRPVISGLVLQFLLGIFCIRWSVGRAIFECFGEKVVSVLDYAKEGSRFVFGDFLVLTESPFAFTALPTIFFCSSSVSVLYYLGTMQWVLLKLGWILQCILGTTVCESVNAAGNIFLGQTESPLIIKPYIPLLTESEIHAIMVSGFSTVSGTMLAAYISVGAEAQHLITASVMAAPASLAISKLMFPETEETETSSGNIQFEKSKDSSVLDAASNGATQAINLVLNIIANLVAFIAFISFADGMIQWVTFLVGFNDVGIRFILGKVFMPVSWALGVDWADCEAVGNVIGTKTIVNEFIAYRLLGDYKKSGEISLRSSAIATYAICGFASTSAMGILIGALSILAPSRRTSITKVAFRAFVSGCFVSLLTASIAGLLMTDEMIEGSGAKI